MYKSFVRKTGEGNRLKYIKEFFVGKKSQSSKCVLAE